MTSRGFSSSHSPLLFPQDFLTSYSSFVQHSSQILHRVLLGLHPHHPLMAESSFRDPQYHAGWNTEVLNKYLLKVSGHPDIAFSRSPADSAMAMPYVELAMAPKESSWFQMAMDGAVWQTRGLHLAPGSLPDNYLYSFEDILSPQNLVQLGKNYISLWQYSN